MKSRQIPEERGAVITLFRHKIDGQLRSFISDRPSILEGVIWYPEREDRVETLINSISKRIVNDLTSEASLLELRAALLEPVDRKVATEAMAHHSVAKGEGGGNATATLVPQSEKPDA